MIFVESLYCFFLLRKQLPHVTLRHSFVTLSSVYQLPQAAKASGLGIPKLRCFFSFCIFYLQRFFSCMANAFTSSIFTFQLHLAAKGMIVIATAYANHPSPPADLVRIALSF